MKKHKAKKSNRGMSLIEVMIVMTIMSLIGLGTATLMKNMFSIQQRSNLKATAREIKNNMETILKNDTAFSFAINNNAPLSCLQDAVGNCAQVLWNGSYTAPNAGATNLDIYDTTGAVWYGSSAGTAGFSADDGSVCGTFNPAGGAGDDACPFRYDLHIYYECPAATNPCDKPQLIVIGVMSFNPADPSDPRNRLNVDDYHINFRRGERVRYEPLEILHSVNDDSGGGDCAAANTWYTRPLTSENYDSGNNSTMGADSFTLVPGTYECKVVAQGYQAMDGFSVRLQDTTNGNSYPIGGAFSGYNSSAYATGTATLQLSANATFELQHMCSGPGSLLDPKGGENYEMGIPTQGSSGYGGGSVFTSITCVRSS